MLVDGIHLWADVVRYDELLVKESNNELIILDANEETVKAEERDLLGDIIQLTLGSDEDIMDLTLGAEKNSNYENDVKLELEEKIFDLEQIRDDNLIIDLQREPDKNIIDLDDTDENNVDLNYETSKNTTDLHHLEAANDIIDLTLDSVIDVNNN